MPAHKITEIETERFILRPLHPAILAWKTFDWTKEKDAFQYLGWKTYGMSLRRWYRHLRSYSRKSTHCRAILAKPSGRCIGFHIVSLNRNAKSASNLIFVGDKSWRGKRVQLEVAGAVIDHYFETFQIDRVGSTVSTANTASIRNTYALGYKLEGTIRESFPLPDGTKTDALIFGMLRSDWQERKAGMGQADQQPVSATPPVANKS